MPRLWAAWRGLDPAVLLAPVRAHLPTPPARILDVSAGNGQITRHLSRLGHDRAGTRYHGVAPRRGAGRPPDLVKPGGGDTVAGQLLGMICIDRIEPRPVQPVNRAAGVTWTWPVLHGRR